ncbi:MAG: divergent polysaccharide deacetylase family protein, partial [Pikeienuella sp.]
GLIPGSSLPPQRTDAPPAAPTRAAAPAPESGPAGPLLEINSTPFDGDLSRPLLAILLTGAGGEGAAPMDLAPLAGRVAVGVAPEAPDPAGLAEVLRRAGHETLVEYRLDAAPVDLVDLSGAGPVIGVALVGIAPGADLPALVRMLGDDGAALVDLTAIGGSSAFRAAEGRNLPAAPAGRRIDEIANAGMVYQALERAAFDARRDGAIVAVAEAGPAVIAGVRRWISVKAGVSAELVPLSAVIAKRSR